MMDYRAIYHEEKLGLTLKAAVGLALIGLAGLVTGFVLVMVL